MVEYGNGIGEGPAGQVGGGGGSHPLVSGGDPFANIGRFIDQGMTTLQSLSPLELLVLAAVVFVGLVILRKALF